MELSEHEISSTMDHGSNLTGDSKLDAVYEGVHAFVQNRFSEFESNIAENISTPLKVLCQQMVEAHKVILDELGGNADAASLWQFEKDYREQVEHHVIERVQAFLEISEPVSVLNSEYESFLDDLADHFVEYPEVIQLPESSKFFAHDPMDTSSVSLKKFSARTRQKFSKLGRSIRSALGAKVAEPVLRVPVADIVVYHLRRRIPAVAVASYRSLHRDLASFVGSFEFGISDWFSDVLKADRKLSRELRTDKVPNDDGDEASAESNVAIFTDVLKAANTLQEKLVSLSEFEPSQRHPEKDSFAFSWELFRLGLKGRGTFLSALPLPVSQLGDPKIVGGASEFGSDWKAWHGQVIDRLTMINSLIDLRNEMLVLEDDLIDEIGQASIESLRSAFSRLSDQLENASELVSTNGSTVLSSESLAEFLGLLEQKEQEIAATTSWLRSLPGFISADKTIDSASEGIWKRLQDFIDTLPESLVIHPASSERMVDPRVGLRTIRMKEAVKQTLHTPLPTRLVDTARPVKRELASAWTSADLIEGIVTFNIDAAKDEINAFLGVGDTKSTDTEERTLASTTTSVVELAGDGLLRAKESINEVTAGVEVATDALFQKISKEFLSDWTVIHQSVRTSDARTEQWAEIWSRTIKRVETTSFKASKTFDKLQQNFRLLFRLSERRARGLIRRGQTAVGVLEQSDSKRSRTVQAIASVSAFKSEMPIVYRRLFSFSELTNASLIESRSKDLVWVRNFSTAWRKNDGNGVAILIGSPGSGKSSFLNVLGETALKEFETRSVRLNSRVASESDLAQTIANALSFDGAFKSLNELEAQIALTDTRTDAPAVVVVDDFEHLFLQISHGRDLFVRFMLFLARNDRNVCWILAIGTPAWKYLSRTCPQIVGFASTYELSLIDQTGFEAIITSRHRRSGLPIVFEEERATKKFLTDRFKRVRTPEEKQSMLRDSYFESLRKASGQNIMLALFYWTSSLEFNENGDLLVKPLQSLSFDFLNRYEPVLAFSLRSLIVHKTLSVEEHNEVFNFTDDQTSFTLERLVNDHMICLADSDPDVKMVQPERYTPDMRFRVHPLVQNPVSSMLSRSNLLH